MNRHSLADELDQQIERLLGARDTRPQQIGNALLAIAEDLMATPRTSFRHELEENLKAEADGASRRESLEAANGWYGKGGHGNGGHRWDHLLGGSVFAELLPTLTGKDFRVFPVDHRSFVFSFLSHTLLIALIASGIWVFTAPITKNLHSVPSVTFLAFDRGGGGSGRHIAIPVSGGTPPKFSDQQLSPPVLVENHAPRLPVASTVIGPPDVKLPESEQLGDLIVAAGSVPSNGAGSGGAMGTGSGTGLGIGIGPGVGPGRDGGFGGETFSTSVIAPRAIYSPDPEYSEEARITKQQGTVVLSLIVDLEGRPRDIHVVRSLGMGLDEKAIEALHKWRFEPGKKGGIRVAMHVNVEVSFRLY
ncbi:MAG: energy transducer TonB [Acidobacteria bacterium]|nr:energy transducer TonB [Acidobacteriota bacterium]